MKYYIMIMIFISSFSNMLMAEERNFPFNHSVNIEIGERFTKGNLDKYIDKAYPCYIGLGFAQDLLANIAFDVNIKYGGAIYANRKNSNTFTFVEPSVGLFYRYLIGPQFPIFIECGENYVYATLKSDTDNFKSSNHGYGLYYGGGFFLPGKDYVFWLGARYSYVPVSFGNYIRSNVDGFAVYIKFGINL